MYTMFLYYEMQVSKKLLRHKKFNILRSKRRLIMRLYNMTSTMDTSDNEHVLLLNDHSDASLDMIFRMYKSIYCIYPYRDIRGMYST